MGSVWSSIFIVFLFWIRIILCLVEDGGSMLVLFDTSNVYNLAAALVFRCILLLITNFYLSLNILGESKLYINLLLLFCIYISHKLSNLLSPCFIKLSFSMLSLFIVCFLLKHTLLKSTFSRWGMLLVWIARLTKKGCFLRLTDSK